MTWLWSLVLCREDWKPVLTINSIIYGLQYLFLVSSCSASLSQFHLYLDEHLLVSLNPAPCPSPRNPTPRTR